MEKKNLLLDGYLCNYYDKAYEKNIIKYEIILNFSERLTEINSIIEKVLKKKVENKKLRKTLSSFKGDNFHDLFLSLNQTMESIFTNNFNMFNKILKDVSNLKESFKEYFAKYKDYSAREKKLLIKLNEVEINKNNFFESAKKAEMSIYEYLKKKIMDKKEKPKINEDLKNNTKNDSEKYKLKLSETNEELKLFNKNQKDMFVIENEFRKSNNYPPF